MSLAAGDFYAPTRKAPPRRRKLRCIRTSWSNKKGVSLMISYVLLITIAIILSIAVFSWLSVISNIKPIAHCDDGTSILITDYKCENGFSLLVRNSGRFNISGFILQVSGDSEKAPSTLLVPLTSTSIAPGEFFFVPPLSPGDSREANFSNTKRVIGDVNEAVGFNNIMSLRLQPFILRDNKQVVCENAVIKQDIVNCNIKKTTATLP